MMEEASYLKLEPDEEIIFVKHRHITSLLPVAVAAVLVMIALVFFSVEAFKYSTSIPIPLAMINLVLFFLGLFMMLVFLVAAFVYWQNRVVLTNRHYLQIDQIGLFNRAVNKLHLNEIQDVRGARKGFFATLLNFGEIEVETAGERENFFFRPIGDPLDVAEEINECRQRYFGSTQAKP